MTEQYPKISGGQCAGILRRSVSFVNELGATKSGLYEVDFFESSLNVEGVPYAHLHFATYDQTHKGGKDFSVEGRHDEGIVYSSYSYVGGPRSEERLRTAGHVLALMADLTEEFPLPISRVAGTLVDNRNAPAVEASTDGSAQQQAAFDAYLERGGWPYEQDPRLPYHYHIIASAGGALCAVEFSLYPEV